MKKKRAIFTIIACSIAVVFLGGVLAVGLHSDGPDLLAPARGQESTSYGHENVIELDPAEDPIEELEITWEDGPVQVIPTTGSLIRITETSNKELTDEEHMQVSAGGRKLEINWDHSRFRFISFRLSFFHNTSKSLVVELPEAVAQALTEVDCSNISGAVAIEGLACQEGAFSTVSGNLSLTGITAAEGCTLSTISGDITARGLTAQALHASTTSGALNVSGAALEEADFDTVSGVLVFEGGAQAFSHSTVSGGARAQFTACPQELNMNSVSGGLTVVLPPASSFTAGHDTISGAFTCDFPTTGSQDGRTLYGTGQAQGQLDFSTTSGNMQVATG